MRILPYFWGTREFPLTKSRQRRCFRPEERYEDKDLLLGIDIGTTGTKCSVYDFRGIRVASAYREYP